MRATDCDERLKSTCAVMKVGAATARTLASLVGAEERLGLARAVVFRVVSKYWKATAAARCARCSSSWPHHGPPARTGPPFLPHPLRAEYRGAAEFVTNNRKPIQWGGW